MLSIQLGQLRSDTLLNHLKAYGLMRILHQQFESGICGWWSYDGFVLDTSHSHDEILDFFANDYVSTPILSPWNKGSGFEEKDRNKALTPFLQSESPRFAELAESIRISGDLLAKYNDEMSKSAFIQSLRNGLPDSAIEWIDAIVPLKHDGTVYHTAIGRSGGNDGHWDYSRNFLWRLQDVFDIKTGTPKPNCKSWLMQSLFPGQVFDGDKYVDIHAPVLPKGLIKGSLGLFGSEQESIHPWDVILLMEGICGLSLSAQTQMQIGLGDKTYEGFAVQNDLDFDHHEYELWIPSWIESMTWPGIKAILDNQHQLSRRQPRFKKPYRTVKTVTDKIRSVRTKPDMDVATYHRFLISQRNGRAHIAIHTGDVIQ